VSPVLSQAERHGPISRRPISKASAVFLSKGAWRRSRAASSGSMRAVGGPGLQTQFLWARISRCTKRNRLGLGQAGLDPMSATRGEYFVPSPVAARIA